MKLCLEDKTDSLLRKISKYLSKQNIECYLVGGYIRDVLLCRTTRDIDLTLPQALDSAWKISKILGGKYVVLDETNEVARIVFTEPKHENPWYLDFSSLKGTIENNLSQRDFTIDAMAINLKELEEDFPDHLIDPFHGQEDIRSGLIKAVSKNIFREDPARLLRAVRLAAECGLSIDRDTETLIEAQSQLICGVAGERIREELLRLFSVPDSAPFIYYLDRLGLLAAIFPVLEDAKGIDQPFEHYWDVFRHSVETVAALERLLKAGEAGKDPVIMLIHRFPKLMKHIITISGDSSGSALLKLTALLHDIAKPKTRSIEPNGRARFLGHTKDGAEMATVILRNLRFSNREIKRASIIIDSHLRPWQMGVDNQPTHRAIYRFFRDTEEPSIDIIVLSLADFLATRGPDLKLPEWEKHCNMMEYILSEHEKEEARVVPIKLIDGHDLINIFGLKPGPKIGQLLESLHEAQGIGEIATREDALAFAGKHINDLQASNGISIKERHQPLY